MKSWQIENEIIKGYFYLIYMSRDKVLFGYTELQDHLVVDNHLLWWMIWYSMLHRENVMVIYSNIHKYKYNIHA